MIVNDRERAINELHGLVELAANFADTLGKPFLVYLLKMAEQEINEQGGASNDRWK